jgi:hypothetical protein
LLRQTAGAELIKLDGLNSKRKCLAEGAAPEEQAARWAQRFVERARLALDPVPAVRLAVARALSKHVLEKVRVAAAGGARAGTDCAQGLNLAREGAVLCLLASAGAAKAQTEFKALVKMLAGKSQEYRLADDEKRATLCAPELILPNLVYLLAHHPALPRDDAGAFVQQVSRGRRGGRAGLTRLPLQPDGQRTLTRPLTLLLDALAAAHGGPRDGAKTDGSVSFMLALLSQMRQRSDARDASDVRVHLVGDLARAVIQQHVKYSPDALQAYAGPLPLPVCFAEPAAQARAPPRTPAASARAQQPALGLPSPISYLPVGFELVQGKKRGSTGGGGGGGPGEPKKRPSLNASTASSARKAAKKPRRSREGGGEDSQRATRRQPSRKSSGANRSYAEYFESEEESEGESGQDAESEL